jgi:hypothetical protein
MDRDSLAACQCLRRALQAALGGVATAAAHETQAVAIEGISWTLGSVSNPVGGSKGRASRTAPPVRVVLTLALPAMDSMQGVQSRLEFGVR